MVATRKSAARVNGDGGKRGRAQFVEFSARNATIKPWTPLYAPVPFIRIRPLYSIRFVDSIPLFDSAMAAADDAHQARGANPMRLHRIARIPWQWAIKGGNWAGATSVDHPRLHNFRAALSGDSLTRLTPKLAREHA
jgi:hypothetical protein